VNAQAKGSREPVQVAVNVMRTRVTVVGFNIAVITFQFGSLRSVRVGSVELPSLHASVHLTADVALFTGLALAMVALVTFVVSSAYDRVGVCDHWSLVARELRLYISLAQTVSAVLGPYAPVRELMAADFSEQATAAATVRWAVVGAGGVAWLLATYLGPIVALVRSPFGRRATATLAIAYVIMVLALAGLGQQASLMQAARAEGAGQAAPTTFLEELLQPIRW
jgi:hypothetical protein